MDDKSLDRLFSGDVSKLIPLPRRVVRLFISSTFTDMTLERNSLMERVYPKLKKYCRERHGLDFQVVDMRWGVRDEATDDHQTVNLCSREIDNCQRVSLGPNFVGLIGDKYGFRPLLNRIKSTEYRALRRCLIELDINTDFLDTWYKEDLNAVPAEYLLQPISSILKNFTNRNEPELQSIDQRIWTAIQERLHELLMIGSNRLVRQGRMSEREQLMKYSISVTEREVIEGCLDVNDAKSRCLVYIRSIRNLRSHLNNCLEAIKASKPSPTLITTASPAEQSAGKQGRRKSSSIAGSEGGEARKASLKIGEDSINLNTSNAQTSTQKRAEKARRLIGRYIDLRNKDGNWELDEEAQLALENLRSNKLTNKLPANGRNLINFQVHWSETDGLTLKLDEVKQYLAQLNDHFYMSLTRMIRKASKQETKLKSGLVSEVLQHSHYAKHVSKAFHGRRQELVKVRAYILSSFELGAIPMFIYGVNGSGKTSTLARAATLARQWVHLSLNEGSMGISGHIESDGRWDEKPCIIMRFCCTTPSSSSITGVLTSVCRQLQYNFYQFGPLNGMMNELSSNQPSEGSSWVGDFQLPYERLPEDFVRLVFTFRRLLDNCRHECHRKRKFIIILDSIDRLSSPADSSLEVRYSWLTSIVRLPPNVRLLVSCSSDIYSNTVEEFKYLKRHFLELNHNYRKRFSSLNSLDNDEDNVHTSSRIPLDLSHINDQDGSYSQPTSIEFHLAQPDARKSSEIAIDRYRFVKRVIVPAIRLLRRQSTMPASEQNTTNIDGSGLLDPDHRSWKISPTFGVGNLLAPVSKDSGSNSNSASSSPGNMRMGNRISATSSPRDSLEDLSAEDPIKTSNRLHSSWILHVKPMGVALALGVVQRWLADYGRTLTRQQWTILENSFGHCSRPIFVKLAFGEVINWKSYSTQSDARGHTFGSALLSSDSPELAESLEHIRTSDGDSEEIDALRKLMQHSMPNDKLAASETRESQFIWQVLTMEQQWVNYLDYKQRQQIDSPENGTDNNSDIVIRVGTQATSGSSSGAPDGGSGSVNSDSFFTSICHLSNTIDNAICQLFARIELQHGYVLTKHSLSYITAARNGICENELEDILSLDDVVLDDVFQYHLPPVRRIPPLLWTRIRNDLPDYLSERDADGMIVISWHHSQFKQVTLDRYLTDPAQKNYIYSTMADYFLGKWADKPKPFKCTKQQIQMAAEQLESAVQQSIRDSQSSAAQPTRSSLTGSRLAHGGSASVRAGTSFSVRARMRSSDQRDRLQWMQAKADRRVPHQPLRYHGERIDLDSLDSAEPKSQSVGKLTAQQDGGVSRRWRSERKKYNLRKLTELPYHLMCSGRFVDLANHVIFNYNWLYAAIDSMGLQALLNDFHEARARMVAEIEKRKTVTVTVNSNELESIAEEPERTTHLEEDSLRSIMSQMDILSNALRLSSSSIHSDTQMLAPQLLARLLPLVRRSTPLRLPGNNVKLTKKSASYRTDYLQILLDQCDKDGSNDCSLLPTDHCLQSPDGLQLSSLEGHQFAVMSMAMAADQRHLLAVSSKFIMWDISTGEVARDIDPKIEGSLMMCLQMGLNNQYAVAYTNDNLVLALDILTQQVAKFDPKLRDKSGGHLQICGMNLIDKLGATKFLIWTQTNWLVLRIVSKDEFDESTGFNSMAQRFSIEAQYSIELHDIHADRSSLIIGVDHDNWDECTFVKVVVKNEQVSDSRQSIFLLTLRTSDTSKIAMWPQNLPACCSLALNSSLHQLIYADLLGDVYLTRRRRTCWSKAKRLISPIESHKLDSRNLFSTTGNDAAGFAPQAIELVEDVDTQELLNKYANLNNLERSRLAELERQIDNLDSNEVEIRATEVFSSIVGNPLALDKNTDRPSTRKGLSSPIKVVKLFYGDRVALIQLDAKQIISRTFVLPRDVRNVCIKSNESQIKGTIIGPRSSPIDLRYLVVAAGRRLLVYSIGREMLVQSIEAHGARILELVAVQAADIGAGQGGCVASSSLDKTVNIWNLSNLDKETHTIERMNGPIDYLTLAPQRPMALCLSRGQLALYDWRRLKLLSTMTNADLVSPTASFEPESSNMGAPRSSRGIQGMLITGCKFSTNSRYICISTQRSIHLYSLDEHRSPIATAGPIGPSSPKSSSDSPNLRPCFAQLLPISGTVRKIKFILQDSRLLVIIDCLHEHERRQSESSEATASNTASNTTSEHLLNNIVVLCYSIPDGRCMFNIEYYSPIVSRTTGTQYLAAESTLGQLARASSKQVRLPVLTRDHSYIVTVESNSANSRPQAGGENRGETSSPNKTTSPSQMGRRRSSVISRVPLDLNAYSTRDGSIARSIDLSQLEQTEHQLNSGHTGDEQQDVNRATHGLRVYAKSNAKQIPRPVDQLQLRFISINSDQFTRMKAIMYLERQSVVALLDDYKGSSFLIDINSRQLVSSSTIWNGRVSSDGRYGLSRMFKSASLGKNISLSSKQKGLVHSHSNILNSDGLQLLEMRHCRPLKILLSNNQLLDLSGQDLQTSGSDLDFTCGFTVPNNQYVYCFNSRLKRLLLIRARDNKLVANYKISVPITRVKCTSDGYSLVLAHVDGSLTSLAIADPQQSDTLVRLAHLPSRCKN